MQTSLFESMDFNKRIYAMMGQAAKTGSFRHTKVMNRDTLVWRTVNGKLIKQTLPKGSEIVLHRFTVKDILKFKKTAKERRPTTEERYVAPWEDIKSFVVSLAKNGQPPKLDMGKWMATHKG